MCYAVSVSAEVAHSNEGIAVVSGRGEVLKDGLQVSLMKWSGDTGETVATDTVRNGKFSLAVPVGEGLTIASISLYSPEFPSMIHKLYLAPDAKVEIDAIDYYMYTWPVKSSVPEQEEYELFINNSKDIGIEFQKAVLKYSEKMSSALERQESERIRDEYIHVVDSLERSMQLRDLELLKERPVSVVWLDKARDFAKMSGYYHSDTEDLKSMYANLDDSVKNSPKGRSLYGYLYPDSPLGLGDDFPDTEFNDLDGKPHHFSEFNGKWVLVDLWSAGCAPCRWALPELRELKEKYPDTLELVSLSMDTDDMWRQQSKELMLEGNNWNEGKEDYGLFSRLGFTARPSFVVVTPDGKIKDTWSGYATGSLKQKMSFYARPKGETAYTESNGCRSVMYPRYETNKTDNVLDIDRIEICDEGTKVFFSFIYYPNYWISIAADTYLTDSSGTKYTVIDSEGIVLGEHLFADDDGKGSFSITYEEIPENIKTIDFHESLSDDNWTIERIVLKP